MFSDYTPLAGGAELMRRLLSPLAAAEAQRELERSHQQLAAQSIDLAAEKFLIYVPPHEGAHGYGVLAFVPPWDDARLPQGWAGVLDRYGLIFVSAARSGNDADVIGRREPLALLGAWNVMRRYPVDAGRVYVGGFSGGARIALRLALGYPDFFRGALLDAGSDPIGAGGPPLPPPRELLWRFQEGTRLVYLTGERDTLHLSMDSASLESMRRWCVFDVVADTIPGAAHELAGPAALARALAALARPVAPEPGRLSACRARIEQGLAARLAEVQSLAGAGRRAAAQRLLGELDRHFGGLAAPRSLELEAALE